MLVISVIGYGFEISTSCSGFNHGSSYVVIKKAACTAEVAASFDLRKATLTAQLLYDTQPPKPVDYVHKPPLEAFVHISENGQSARVE